MSFQADLILNFFSDLNKLEEWNTIIALNKKDLEWFDSDSEDDSESMDDEEDEDDDDEECESMDTG